MSFKKKTNIMYWNEKLMSIIVHILLRIFITEIHSFNIETLSICMSFIPFLYGLNPFQNASCSCNTSVRSQFYMENVLIELR